MFSSRTNWDRSHNRLALLLEERVKQEKPVLDLTLSNPTRAGFEYPSDLLLSALLQSAILQYNPDPLGLRTAREAIVQYYSSEGISVSASNVALTASTSEAYGWLFTLLCEAGDAVLVPAPSYPLFEYLARMHAVAIRPYRLLYDGEWHIDFDSMERAITPATKAIVVVSPHNPTGMFLKKDELIELHAIASQRGLALIVDEVFSAYGFTSDERRVTSTAATADVLTFTLNGISKLCGLPQLKLGWMVVGGPEAQRRDALHRLEILADTFLSVNTPVQVALPQLLALGANVRAAILDRVRSNFEIVRETVSASSPLTVLGSEGGWYGILKVPRVITEEEWAVRLLSESGVYVFPGYYFDFEEDGFLVVSLLVAPPVLRKGVHEIVKAVSGL